MKTSDEIRQAFIDFWRQSPRNAKQVPNSSLVPNNDPTLLFVNSGMFPLVPYLGGQPHPLGNKLFNVQRCVRTIDIDEVGDYNHLILFEMIGNWSLGSFSKTEQILWKLELYVEKFGLDPHKIFATVWGGDDSIPRDDEAIAGWKKAFRNYGIDAEFSENLNDCPQAGEDSSAATIRIFPYGKSDNWWQRGPDTPGELGGPSSEIFYDMGSELYDTGESLHINDDSGRYLEIGNSVFMEYQFSEAGSWEPMAQKNIDYGGGLDRIVAVVQGKRSVYETDLFMPYLQKLEKLSGLKYEPQDESSAQTRAFRIVAEHTRSTTFMLADGVVPGNKDQGYILRRLIRRMIRFGLELGIEENFAKTMGELVIDKMQDAYPHFLKQKQQILDEVDKEEQKFRRTLKTGLKELHKMIDSAEELTGEKAFYIFETFGFPLELTLEEFRLSNQQRESIQEDFKQAEIAHKQQSRAGAEQKFAGGLADKSEQTTRLHTAHHLLLAALQEVVGEHVHQKGSNITADRLRIDFSHTDKLDDTQKQEIVSLVNGWINAEYPVVRIELPKETAEKIGAEMEFGQNYPQLVSVYMIGDLPTDFAAQIDKTDSEQEILDLVAKFKIVSKEFCGGPHVVNTKELAKSGQFKIKKEQSSGAGVRRIKAVLN